MAKLIAPTNAVPLKVEQREADPAKFLPYVGQDSVTKSLTINGLLANRSKSISEQRRALMLP